MFRGLATVSSYAHDQAAAKAWYRTLFGTEPDFDVPGYFEFDSVTTNMNSASSTPPTPHRAPPTARVARSWSGYVDDLDATLATLLKMGAVEYQSVTERGDGFVTASVVDPFGTIIGVMTNQRCVDMLARS